MRYFPHLLAVAIFLPSHIALATEPLKSPYFIDGVHCEGLDDKDLDNRISDQFGDEALAKLGVKAHNQSTCEHIFSEYGITKFQWVTPDDLENFNFLLKKSGKFKTIDVRIEKSESQNHVHLKGRFEQFEPRNYTSFNVQSGYENGGVTGDRDTTKSEALVQFQKRGMENPGSFDVGFTTFRTSAKDPLSLEELKSGEVDVVMNDAEKATQGKQSWQYNELFLRNYLPTGKFVNPISLKVGLNYSKLSQDEAADLNTSYELATEFRPDVLRTMKLSLSLAYSTYTALGSESITTETASSNQKQILFAGFSEDFDTRWLTGHFSAYRSLTSQVHYYGDLDLKFLFTEFAGIKSSLGFSQEQVYGAVLPQHRFGLPNRAQSAFYYLGENNFRALDADNKISFKVGFSNLDSSGPIQKSSYSRGQSFAELGLKTRTDKYDVGLSFIYGNQRLY